MKTITYTYHSQDRLQNRLPNLITAAELNQFLAGKNLPFGKTNIEVKKVPYTQIKDLAVKPDGIARGDSIVAVVDNQGSKYVIVTVMLRKSWSKATTPQNVVIR